MSYPMGLDEYDDESLVIELGSRLAKRSLGDCDYCQRPSSDPAKCGSGRHMRTAQELRDLLLKYGVTEKTREKECERCVELLASIEETHRIREEDQKRRDELDRWPGAGAG